LKFQFRHAQIDEWMLPADGAWASLTRESGIAHLQRLMHRKEHQSLMSAFVERWHPETSSFHMPWGEMTITLHDASLILGLPIDGCAAIPVVEDRPQMARFADFFHVGDHWMTRPNYDKGGVSHLQL